MHPISRMTTYERVRQCVAYAFQVDETYLTQASAVFGGGMNCRQPPHRKSRNPHLPADQQETRPDSLEMVDLIVCLEKEFGLEISDEEASRMLDLSLGELAAEIDRRRPMPGEVPLENESV